MIRFHKYHGTGNDFIIIDNRDGKLFLTTEQIAFLCDRHFGIGSDGLMFLENSDHADFKMRYFNSDGNEGSMCGNGGRCIVAFANKLEMVKKYFVFDAIDGLHHAELSDSEIRLKMNDVDGIEKIGNDFFLNTGSPHYVRWATNINSIDVFKEGREIRYNERFNKTGTNVNFIELSEDLLHIRTYERGVENETLSCGTGTVAAAIVSTIGEDNDTFSILVKTSGGSLNVCFNKASSTKFTDIWLNGPASFVFEGAIELN